MEIIEILLAVLVLGVGAVIYFQLNPKTEETDSEENQRLIDLEKERNSLLEERARLSAERDQKLVEMAKVTSELDTEKERKSELEGKGKQLFVQLTNNKNELDNLRTESLALKDKVSKYEAEKKQRDAEHEASIKKLAHAHEKFESEQKRVIQKDEEKKALALAERDRLWNDHENQVLATLRDACQKPEIAFKFYDNNNLPEGYHGHFKPDFLVDFLGQHLYMDAKVSRSENLETYLKAQFKSTAEKLKKFDGKIYKNVFFIVPTAAIPSVRKRVEVVEGFTFFVISPESIEPVLSAYKRITDYENIQDFDPEEREKIVEVMANFEHFIRNQNTANILFAQRAFDVLQKKEALSDDLLKQFELELKNLKPLKLKESDFKKMSESVDDQKKSVAKMTAPEVKVSAESLDEAEKLF